MADIQRDNTGSPATMSVSWRKRLAFLVALCLAGGGLLLLERNPASAAPAPHVVSRPARPSTPATATVAALNSVTSQLQGAASLLTQTVPKLDLPAAAAAAAAAASAQRAAGLSKQLASMTTIGHANAAQVTATVGALQAALATTNAEAGAASSLTPSELLQFCPFTIQIGPIVIDIPAIGLHIVIGPFFIHFVAPCFLSGRIPTHLP